MEVATQASVEGLYRPPVLRVPLLLYPPQTIISVPFQTAVWRNLSVIRISVPEVACQEPEIMAQVLLETIVQVQLVKLGLRFPTKSVALTLKK